MLIIYYIESNRSARLDSGREWAGSLFTASRGSVDQAGEADRNPSSAC